MQNSKCLSKSVSGVKSCLGSADCVMSSRRKPSGLLRVVMSDAGHHHQVCCKWHDHHDQQTASRWLVSALSHACFQLSQNRPYCVCPDASRSFHVLQVVWEWLCRGAGYFATGMVLVRQGQEKEGQLLLGKALRFAHRNLSNHQLVSEV